MTGQKSFDGGSTLPFDKLAALSGVEGLTVPERSRRERPEPVEWQPSVEAATEKGHATAGG